MGWRGLPRCTASSHRQHRLRELLRGGRHPPQRCRAERGAGRSARALSPLTSTAELRLGFASLSPPAPDEPISRTAQPRPRPPTRDSSGPSARLPHPRPGQVPSAAALLLLPVERLLLSPEISGALPTQFPPLLSVHLPVAHSCPSPTSPQPPPPHTAPGERTRTPCPPPRSARRADPPWFPADRPHPPAVPQPPSRGQTRPSRHPAPQLSSARICPPVAPLPPPHPALSGRLHPAAPTGRSSQPLLSTPGSLPRAAPFPRAPASVDGHPPPLTRLPTELPRPPTLSSREGRGRALPTRTFSRPQLEKAEEPHPRLLPPAAPAKLPRDPSSRTPPPAALTGRAGTASRSRRGTASTAPPAPLRLRAPRLLWWRCRPRMDYGGRALPRAGAAGPPRQAGMEGGGRGGA